MSTVKRHRALLQQCEVMLSKLALRCDDTRLRDSAVLLVGACHAALNAPPAYCAMISGGGLRMGTAVGATNSKGEYPAQSPLTPQDMLATVYQHLGIRPDQTFNDYGGRPIAILPHGEPIRQLM